MGNGMNKILPGLYVGNIRDSKDETQLAENKITHILSIHDNAKPILKDKKYMCIMAGDNPSQDLLQYVSHCNDFIHNARLNGGCVLVHCLAGVSRSVTITSAYIMTITGLSWREALNSIRGSRRCANPNFGFQRQLLNFQHDCLEKEQTRLESQFPKLKLGEGNDLEECRHLMKVHNDWVLNGDEADTAAGLYPLGHNTYGGVKSTAEFTIQTKASLDNDSSSRSLNVVTNKDIVKNRRFGTCDVDDFIDGRSVVDDIKNQTVDAIASERPDLNINTPQAAENSTRKQGESDEEKVNAFFEDS